MCTAGDTERFIHKDSVVSQISCHNGVYWMVVYNEFKRTTLHLLNLGKFYTL